MKKSLMGKYFMVAASLILISFLILGGGLFWQAYNYSIGEKKQNLDDTATRISSLTADLLGSYNTVREQTFRFLLSTMTDGGKIHALICSTDGQVIITSDDSIGAFSGTYLNESIIEKLAKERYYSGMENLGGVYQGQNYTVGMPVKNTLGQDAGYVFVTTPVSSMRGLMYDISRMFLISSILVFLLAALLSYLAVRSMTKPIKLISTAAKSFAQGDFKTRVPVLSEDEIGELTQAFNNMADSLERSEELRRTFVGNVSHELRSPMTSIGGFVDGILDGTIPPERQEHYLQIISSEVKRLSRLVSRMLDITRLQAKDMSADSTRFDFCELVRRVIIGFESRLEEKHLRMDVQLSEYAIELFANEDAIFQAVYNLTENAIKFSYEGEVIVIHVSSRAGKLWFSIQNRGENIAPDELSCVFDRFHKGDRSRGNDKSGLGLGLYIVKTIVNQHKGDVGVRSANHITEFSFTLPLDNKARRSEAEQSLPPAAHKG